MPVPRLAIPDTALLVVDVQERLMPSIAEGPRVVTNCAILLRTCALLSMPSLVTEQYVRGLGRTVPGVAEAMSDPSARLEKTRFSAVVDMVLEQLRAWNRGCVLVAGVEAQVCVLQTVLDLQRHGYQAYYVTDAISSGQPAQVRPAFERMSRAGALPTGVMSAIYELLEDSTHPAFRDCLDLVKRIAPERS